MDCVREGEKGRIGEVEGWCVVIPITGRGLEDGMGGGGIAFVSASADGDGDALRVESGEEDLVIIF